MPFSMRAVQKIEITILKDINDFCKRHNIRYFLYCGTLLGCIRHGGFIPWDDDIDIAMSLSDFKTFSNLIIKDEKFREKYIVRGLYGDYQSYDLWIKIIRKNTVYFEKECMQSKIDKGVSFDIFPLIGEYDGKISKSFQAKALTLQHNLHLWEYAKMTDYFYVLDPKVKKLAKRINFLPDFMPNFLINMIKTLFWRDPEEHKMCGTIDAAPFAGKYEYKKTAEIIEGVFEGDKYPIPKDYDYFLKKMYWNYMELPPVEKRDPHHFGDVCFAYDTEVAEEAGLEI